MPESILAAGRHILLIDDDVDLQRLVMIRLRAAGYMVVVAGDGISAMKLAVHSPPDLILLDLGLPAGDGFKTMERLQAHPLLCEVPIVVISGRDAETSKPRALKAGASGYVKKPVTTGELETVIARLLHRGSLLDRSSNDARRRAPVPERVSLAEATAETPYRRDAKTVLEILRRP